MCDHTIFISLLPLPFVPPTPPFPSFKFFTFTIYLWPVHVCINIYKCINFFKSKSLTLLIFSSSIFSYFVLVFCQIYLFSFALCTCICMHVYMCVLVWKAEVDNGYLPQLLYIWLFEEGPLIKCESHSFG